MSDIIQGENPEMVEVRKDSIEALADNLITVGLAFESLKKTRLNDRALVILIQDATKANRKDIKDVLNALKNLDKYFLDANS